MRTIAFYSYKGGVGRTLAIAHVAYWLGKQDQSVFLLDMDLEAPGMHYKIEKYAERVSPVRGLVDYIGHFQQESKAATSLEPYVISLKLRDVGMPRFWLMPAGNPLDDAYWRQLNRVEWKDFLYGEGKRGSLLFLELKAHIEKAYNPDFLLIDSRTGLTDLTGIGLELLADDAVVLGVNNQENIDGSRIVMERLRRREKLPIKAEKTRLHFVLTRIPAPLSIEDQALEEKIKESVKERLNMGSGIASGPLVTQVNVIHIDPEQAIEEKIRFMEKEWEKYPILKDYQDLVYGVTGLGRSAKLEFGLLHLEFLLEKNSARKKELAKQLATLKTNIAEHEFQRGYIANEFLKETQTAIEAYTHALVLRPDNAITLNNRGNVYHSLGQMDLALEDYNKAIKVMPDYSLAYCNRGNVHFDNKDYDLAFEDYSKAIELQPDLSIAYNNRGSLYHKLGKYDLAMLSYDKAIEINPNQSDAYANRGGLFARNRQYDLALIDLNKANALTPDDATARYNRAYTYYCMQHYSIALEDIHESIQLDPSASAFGLLAEIQSAIGNSELFYDSLEKAIKLDPIIFETLDGQTIERHKNELRFQYLQKKYKSG